MSFYFYIWDFLDFLFTLLQYIDSHKAFNVMFLFGFTVAVFMEWIYSCMSECCLLICLAGKEIDTDKQQQAPSTPTKLEQTRRVAL